MKKSIFGILLALGVLNSFASNQWIFSIPGDRQYPIQLLNLGATARHIKIIQLFRQPSGQVYEANLIYADAHPDPIMERYAQPTPQIVKLDSLDALGWIHFWTSVHQKSPLTLEAVKTLNSLYRIELTIPNLHSEQELD